MFGAFSAFHARLRDREFFWQKWLGAAAKKAADRLIFGVALVGPAMTLPQVWQLFSTKIAAGLAPSTWATYAALGVFWFFYAKKHGEAPLMLSAALNALVASAVVLGIVMYG